MTRKILVRTVLIAVLFALLSAGAADRVPLSATGRQRSPINPEYQQYLMDKAKGLIQTVTADGHPLGEIPPLVNRPFTRQSPYVRKRDAAPASYDLRTVGGVTDVRDQGQCGSCWVFGTYSSLESNLKFDYVETRDFSEQHMNKKHGFDIKPCEGGHEWMATAYLSRWSGPWDESKMKYPYSAGGDVDAANPVQKHIQNVWFLPARTSYTDNDEIKDAVMAYGALKVSIYWNGVFWNGAHNAYYCTAAGSGTNHAVAIIGWDDDFATTNFNTAPPGNGAFLIRNSWGAYWGDSGYFWVSYYDTRLRNCVGYFDAEANTNYTKNYQYDPLGDVWDYGDEETETAYGANIFKAAGKPNNQIKAVGFWTLAPDTTVEISIYDKVLASNPVSGTQVGTTYKTTLPAGFQTVVLPTPAVVTAGKKFSVVVKFTTPGYFYPVPTEGAVPDYSSKAKGQKNQSFVSLDGTTWKDLYFTQVPYAPDPAHYKGNVCIKAFAGK